MEPETANDVHCELYFLQKYAFFQNTLLLSSFSHPKQTDYFSVCVWTEPPVEVKVILGPS